MFSIHLDLYLEIDFCEQINCKIFVLIPHQSKFLNSFVTKVLVCNMTKVMQQILLQVKRKQQSLPEIDTEIL